MFNSEITTLGHPRAALLDLTVAVLAYNMTVAAKALRRARPSPGGAAARCLCLTTWPSMSGAPTRACSFPCRQRTGRIGPRTPIRRCSACWLWRAASSPANGHKQARPQDRKTQGLGRGKQGEGTCLHGPGAQGSDGTNTLKGVGHENQSVTSQLETKRTSNHENYEQKSILFF